MTAKCKMTGKQTELPCSAAGCPLFGDCIVDYEKATKKSKTNADLIRSMSDEQIAEAFYNLVDNLQTGTMDDLSCLFCDGKNGCIDADGNITCSPDMEKACVLRWLRSPAKEET